MSNAFAVTVAMLCAGLTGAAAKDAPLTLDRAADTKPAARTAATGKECTKTAVRYQRPLLRAM